MPLPHSLGSPKVKEAPAPLRREPRWSQSEGGPHRPRGGGHGGAKAKQTPHPCGGGLGGPKVKEAPTPTRRGPRCSQSEGAPITRRQGPPWSQSEGGPRAHAAGGPAIPSHHSPSHQASLSPQGPPRTGGTRVQPPTVCEGGLKHLLPHPTGRPYPHTARTGRRGFGCNR